MTRIAVLIVAGLLCWVAAAPADAGPAELSDAERAVVRLMDEDLEAQRRANPLEASRRGDRRFDYRLPDLSPQARLARRSDDEARLAAIEALLPSDALSEAARLNAMLLRHELRNRIEADRFSTWQIQLTQQSGPQNTLPQLPDTLSFTTEEHLAAYVSRLEAVPAYLDQVMASMREGMRSGRTPPRIVMGTVAQQAAAHGDERYLTDPQAHAMYKPFAGRADALAERAAKAVSTSVAPAFRRFADFLEKEYVPACRATIAARDLPEGEAYYAWRVRDFTTTEFSPEQIHQIGLGEVARIRAEMMEVIARSDYSRKSELRGDELFRAFVEYLRTDKRFYFDRPEDLLAAYREIAKRVDPEMARLFRTLPRLPYGVREMPRFIAASAPTAYYYPGSLENGVAGYFIANTYLLDQRPKYEMISLTLHEAVPGHHHQIALAQELKDAGQHEWRSTVDYTVFVEGWGLYSERLGLEMGDDPRSPANPEGKGLFTDPYDDFGRLSYEMWRAMRLVVDTGMHALGWPRDRAIQFMLDNSALSKSNIEREVDRYIAWPGQALGYKIGELRIRELRAEAESELGDRFDIRGFHDAVLLQGAVPLEVLDMQVRRWIETTKNGVSIRPVE